MPSLSTYYKLIADNTENKMQDCYLSLLDLVIGSDFHTLPHFVSFFFSLMRASMMKGSALAGTAQIPVRINISDFRQGTL